jgi:DUF4097 and DUF4098 domain-containing protein YvlB
MPTFETPQPVALRISIGAGEVSITAADRTQSTVEVSADSDDEVGRDLVAQTKVEHRDGEISVTAPRQFHVFFGRKPELTVTVVVPTFSTLFVRTSSADVEARGEFGRTHVETASGDVELDTVAELQVRTGSGDVRVHSMEDGGISTGSGDAYVDETHGPLTANSGSGDIVVSEARDAVHANTASGDVQLLRAHSGPVRANTASGDVHVGVASGTAAWLDVRTLSGEVYSDLSRTDAPTEAEHTVQLQVNTASGDITLVHA